MESIIYLIIDFRVWCEVGIKFYFSFTYGFPFEDHRASLLLCHGGSPFGPFFSCLSVHLCILGPTAYSLNYWGLKNLDYLVSQVVFKRSWPFVFPNKFENHFVSFHWVPVQILVRLKLDQHGENWTFYGIGSLNPWPNGGFLHLFRLVSLHLVEFSLAWCWVFFIRYSSVIWHVLVLL